MGRIKKLFSFVEIRKKNMKTLEEQGVSIVKQVSTVIAAKYGYIINADYSDELTELTSADDTELIRITSDGNQLGYQISLSERNDKRANELQFMVKDVIDIVKILN